MKRAVLFGFSSLKKMEAEAVLFLGCASASEKISRFRISGCRDINNRHRAQWLFIFEKRRTYKFSMRKN